LVEQFLRQPVALHLYGEQFVAVGVEQVPPVPLQVGAGVNSATVQMAFPQTVLDGYFWQAPAPSHEPFVPQLAAPRSVHSLPGSVPAAMGPQVPSVPGPVPLRDAVHPWQRPPQATLQHTPSTQFAFVHSTEAPHATPLAFLGVQTPLGPGFWQ
jgi:hypothetical protein